MAYSIYDFTAQAFAYNQKLSPIQNLAYALLNYNSAYIKPEFNNSTSYIAGTRTSDTVFTRSAETWTTDALIGYYAIALDADASHSVFTVHLIDDNDTTTITIDATWGDATLVASADTVLIYETLDNIYDDVDWIKTS